MKAIEGEDSVEVEGTLKDKQMIVQQWWKATTEDKTGKDVNVTYNTITLVYDDATAETKPADSDLPAVSKYGDLNNYGSVDIIDVITMNRFLLGVRDLDPQSKANADVNADKKIDSQDTLNILKRALEMLKDADFPVK